MYVSPKDPGVPCPSFINDFQIGETVQSIGSFVDKKWGKDAKFRIPKVGAILFMEPWSVSILLRSGSLICLVWELVLIMISNASHI
jgi:hypothetical protein